MSTSWTRAAVEDPPRRTKPPLAQFGLVATRAPAATADPASRRILPLKGVTHERSCLRMAQDPFGAFEPDPAGRQPVRNPARVRARLNGRRPVRPGGSGAATGGPARGARRS